AMASGVRRHVEFAASRSPDARARSRRKSPRSLATRVVLPVSGVDLSQRIFVNPLDRPKQDLAATKQPVRWAQDAPCLASWAVLRHFTAMTAAETIGAHAGTAHRFCVAPMMEWTEGACDSMC